MGKKLTEQEIENIIDNTVASFAMEGMHCTEEDKEDGRKILSGELDVEDAISAYINKLSQEKKEVTGLAN